MKLSVVLPALNEAGNIARLVEETYREVPSDLIGEVIVVDDGSDDGTGAEIAALMATGKYAGLRCLRHAARSGQSAAMRTGITAARYPVIATMDGDGQNDPSDISRLAARLGEAVRSAGAEPAIVGVVDGRGVVGLTDEELDRLLAADAPKINTSNVGMVLDQAGACGATTVSATMELAAGAGVRAFATGGIGGVHHGLFDVSADLMALTRFPVAVVCSGVKSILDVRATREALETLGVPVVGYRTDAFPAFYRRASGAHVDWRVDDAAALGTVIRRELERSKRGMIIANPIPEEAEVEADALDAWTREAEHEADAQGVDARARTPFILERLHALSGGATLEANVALVLANAELAGELAVACAGDGA